MFQKFAAVNVRMLACESSHSFERKKVFFVFNVFLFASVTCPDITVRVGLA